MHPLSRTAALSVREGDLNYLSPSKSSTQKQGRFKILTRGERRDLENRIKTLENHLVHHQDLQTENTLLQLKMTVLKSCLQVSKDETSSKRSSEERSPKKVVQEGRKQTDKNSKNKRKRPDVSSGSSQSAQQLRNKSPQPTDLSLSTGSQEKAIPLQPLSKKTRDESLPQEITTQTVSPNHLSTVLNLNAQKITSKITSDLLKQAEEATQNLQKEFERHKRASEIAVRVLKTEKAALTRDKEALTQEKTTLIQDKAALTQEKEALAQDKAVLTQEKEALAQDKAVLTQEKTMLIQDKAVLTQEKDHLTRKLVTKEKEITKKIQKETYLKTVLGQLGIEADKARMCLQQE